MIIPSIWPLLPPIKKIMQLNTYEFNVLTGSEGHAIQQRQRRKHNNINQYIGCILEKE